MKSLRLYLSLVSSTLIGLSANAQNQLAGSLTLSNTGGAGFLQLANQSGAPSTPTSSGRIYFDSSNFLAWKNTGGFTGKINLGGASRVVTLSGSPTLGDWFDQSVKVASSPVFSGLVGGGIGLIANAITNANSVTAASSTDLTLVGGSSGASVVLGQGASGTVRIPTSYTAAGFHWARSVSGTDDVMLLGYNIGPGSTRVLAGENSAWIGIESNYDNGGTATMEGYFRTFAATGGTFTEPFFFHTNRATNSIIATKIRAQVVSIENTDSTGVLYFVPSSASTSITPSAAVLQLGDTGKRVLMGGAVDDTALAFQLTGSARINSTDGNSITFKNSTDNNVIRFANSGATLYNLLGITAVNNYVVGATAGDMFLRSDAGSIIFAAGNAGAAVHAKITASSGVFTLNATTEATTGGAGSLITAGGLYITKSLVTGGGHYIHVKAVTDTYTLDTTTVDELIVCNKATGFTVTLIDATAGAGVTNLGRHIVIKNKGAGTVTVASATGSQIFTTSAQASISLVTGDSVTLDCDGVVWCVD